jgi:sarcosine oxidase
VPHGGPAAPGAGEVAEVVVVGLGAWGACALWQLAAAGLRAVGVERYGIANVHGSSHGGTRMFRTVCTEHPGLVPLAQRSRLLWRRLERSSGEQLLLGSGATLIGPPDGPLVAGSLAAAREHDLDHRVLDAAELREAMPAHADLPPGHVGLVEPDAGVARAEETVRAAVAAARAAGARVVTDCRVLGLSLVDGGVEVHTALATLRARQVVVTAGPWLGQLVDGLPLEVVRMPTTWYSAPTGDDRFDLARLPVFMRELADGEVIWGHGRLPGDDLVKMGIEDGRQRFNRVDLELLDRSTGPADWSALSARLRTAVPGLPELPQRVTATPYARTPDRQFLIGRPRRDPRLVVAGGCSSHGFKHAPAIGELLAGTVLDRPPTHPVAFLDPNRFD